MDRRSFLKASVAVATAAAVPAAKAIALPKLPFAIIEPWTGTLPPGSVFFASRIWWHDGDKVFYSERIYEKDFYA